MKKEQKYLTTSELAKILNISRQAIFKRIKSGQIEAERAGKLYLIPRSSLNELLGGNLSEKLKNELDKGVLMVVREYGETLKLLGKE